VSDGLDVPEPSGSLGIEACDGIERLFGVRPQLRRIVSAERAIGLRPGELLHAGPALHDPRRPTPVLRSSAVMTALHEGWARNEAEAEDLIARGGVILSPAQERDCVVPLAFVVSSGTPLLQVEDGAQPSRAPIHAPVSVPRGTDTRMGHRDPALPDRLAARDTRTAPALEACLAGGPLNLLPLAAHGLASGDDLHSRTAAANVALAAELRRRGAAAGLAEDIEATPLFFLTAWMAGCALMLRALEGGPAPWLVTRGGGNGEHFGIALAGAPHRWTCVDAQAPDGPLVEGVSSATRRCGAIGDSAVIDLFGCGGQALGGAPEPLQAFAGFLPETHEEFAAGLLCAEHPQLLRRAGLDARRVAQSGTAPLVMLAMLAQDGRRGFIGRGVYRPPAALFEQALAAQA
jgi:hypothetical protein